MKYVLGLIRFILIFSFILPVSLFGQGKNRLNQLQEFANRKHIEWQKNKTEAEEFARQQNIPLRIDLPDDNIVEIIKMAFGVPLYYITQNAGAAITTRANQLWPPGSLGLNLTGSGYDKLGEWDGGRVRITHQEFGSRVTQKDFTSGLSNHATHVAGTMIAAGAYAPAKGMAYQADLLAYDWYFDTQEMATAAANGMEISNHSYGYASGWEPISTTPVTWSWYGNLTINENEDYKFGYYDAEANDYDQIAYDAPNYLIVKSAGNDRNDDFLGSHYHGNGTVSYVDEHQADGASNGYDCISSVGVAKNVLTVGAVYEVTDYSGPSDVVMSTFSSWGPADDGRLKPDIVAKGVSVLSTYGTADDVYATYNGTSMSSPNTAGTLALLQQHYQNTHGGTPMRSATLKALVLHTADEAGSNPGPDYKFGWGLLNAKHAAQVISRDLSQNVIIEQELADGESYQHTILIGGENPSPLKVTLAWTDPPGTPVLPPTVDPPDIMLVHDLDLTISDGSTTYYPWTLDPANPNVAAVQTNRNFRDNVEQVYIASAVEGSYTITVDHSGDLSTPQEFSLIIEGATPISTFPFSENFDGLTGIGTTNDWQNSAGDDFDWTPYSYDTPTAGTGPAGDHTSGSGQYLYTEADDPNNPDKNADLISPLFDIGALNNPCLEFWYHMFDDESGGMGNLYIDIYGNGIWNNNILSLFGNQGNQWHVAAIDLSPYKDNSICQVRFRVLTGQSEKSDIAIDDFLIYPQAFFTFTSGSTELHEFANTDVTLQFTTANTSDISLSVIKNNADPGIIPPLPTGVEHVSADRYWSISVLSGTVDGTYSMSIDLDGMSGISDYTTLKLLKRSDATSPWQEVGTNSYGGSGTVVPWTGITSGFSEFAIAGDGDNSLPVTLSLFRASLQGETVLLEWQTESEVENLGYIIRRRGKESEPWQQLASYLTDPNLIGQGDSSQRSHYHYIDVDVAPGNRYQYQLADVSFSGQMRYHDIIEIQVTDTALPLDFTLKDAYPNPFNPITTIQYGLAEDSRVQLTVYDLLGRIICVLTDEKQNAGWHEVTWNGLTDSGNPVGSGLYLLVFKAKDFHDVKKVIFIK